MVNESICDVCGKNLGASCVSHAFLRICSQACFTNRKEAELKYLWSMRDNIVSQNEKHHESEGIKHDADKPRYDLLPPDALHEVVTIFTYGCAKYSARNWEKGMSWGRCFGAAMRHLWAFWRGEDRDPESGHLHLAHAATNCLFLLAYYLRKKGEDDRA